MEKKNEKETCDIIQELKEKFKDIADKAYEALAELTMLEENFDELEEEREELASELDDKEADYEDKIDDLKDIIRAAKDYDYGLKGWRTLETKQDLVDAIERELEL